MMVELDRDVGGGGEMVVVEVDVGRVRESWRWRDMVVRWREMVADEERYGGGGGER